MLLRNKRFVVLRILLLTIIFLGVPNATSAQDPYPFTVLHGFGAPGDGAGVWAGVAVDRHGKVYGTTTAGGAYQDGIVFELTPNSTGEWTETIVYSFCAQPNCTDGSFPFGSAVAVDTAGNLYGDAQQGGLYNGGVLFELTPGSSGWTETILHDFCSLPNCADGFSPSSTPTLNPAGGLYGVTQGLTTTVAFSLIPGSTGWVAGGWTYSPLYTFCSQPHCSDGLDPAGSLTLDSAGNLYGMTTLGGSTGCGAFGCGTVFTLQRQSSGQWKEVVLHRFQPPQSSHDGNQPYGSVTIHGQALYGTTGQGGGGCEAGCGTVFELTPDPGKPPKETILQTFADGLLGDFPVGGVVFDRAGNLYGVTSAGGPGPCGCGVVFRLTPQPGGKWSYSVVHAFSGSDGAQPQAGLTMDSRGNLYGTTVVGGQYGAGVVYEIQLNGDASN